MKLIDATCKNCGAGLQIDAEGKIEMDSEFQYAFDFNGEQEPMIADFDIDSLEVDETGNVIGDYTINAGTPFILHRSSLYDDYDNENKLLFNYLMSDNHIVRICFDREIDEAGYTRIKSNGKMKYEYFESIQNYKIYQW